MRAFYRSIPKLSPYVKKVMTVYKDKDKFYVKQINNLIKKKKNKISVLDVGCGNGTFLYILKTKYPDWEFTGIDTEGQFIKKAKSFKALDGVKFYVRDLLKFEGKYDLVICSSTFQIFEDFKKPLKKLISLINDKGILLCDGMFNTFDVETRLIYCDNSNSISKNKWRKDWNQHSIKTVSNYLNKKKKFTFKFVKIIMNKDLKQNKKIHINQFTFRDENQNNLITNGTNMILNRKLLILKKK